MIVDTHSPSAVAERIRDSMQAVQAADTGGRDRRQVQRGRLLRRPRDPGGGAGAGGRGQACQAGGPSEKGVLSCQRARPGRPSSTIGPR